MPAYLHKANGGKALHEDYIFFPNMKQLTNSVFAIIYLAGEYRVETVCNAH